MSAFSKTAYHYTKCGFFRQISARACFVLYKADKNHFVVGVVLWPEMSCRAHLRALLDRQVPWAQMSSHDQYWITASQIRTLTLHYTTPVPLQAWKGQKGSVYFPAACIKHHKHKSRETENKTYVSKKGKRHKIQAWLQMSTFFSITFKLTIGINHQYLRKLYFPGKD